MKVLLVSDLHVDCYSVYSDRADTLNADFQDIYDRFLSPADAICIAGDIADYEIIQCHFLRFLAEKYREVYFVFGNHDAVVKRSFPPQRFNTTEERFIFVRESLADLSNVHILDGEVSPDGLVGGTMGMCDLGYRIPDADKATAFDPVEFWQSKWYDGRHWNYCGQDLNRIMHIEMKKLESVCAAAPRIVVTHFCPLQMGVSAEYADSPATSMFYFDAARFLDMLPDGTVWHCGHTHNQFDTVWKHDEKAIRIVCNPLGLPEERNAFCMCRKSGVFIIDL